MGHGICGGRGIAEAFGQLQARVCFRHFMLRHSVDHAIIGFWQKIRKTGILPRRGLRKARESDPKRHRGKTKNSMSFSVGTTPYGGPWGWAPSFHHLAER